jgi:hypothetical protein
MGDHEAMTLQELKLQAGIDDNPDQEGLDLFAELIVAECVAIASQEDFDVMMKEGYPCSQTAKKIREHFGVEL